MRLQFGKYGVTGIELSIKVSLVAIRLLYLQLLQAFEMKSSTWIRSQQLGISRVAQWDISAGHTECHCAPSVLPILFPCVVAIWVLGLVWLRLLFETGRVCCLVKRIHWAPQAISHARALVLILHRAAQHHICQILLHTDFTYLTLQLSGEACKINFLHIKKFTYVVNWESWLIWNY